MSLFTNWFGKKVSDGTIQINFKISDDPIMYKDVIGFFVWNGRIFYKQSSDKSGKDIKTGMTFYDSVKELCKRDITSRNVSELIVEHLIPYDEE